MEKTEDDAQTHFLALLGSSVQTGLLKLRNAHCGCCKHEDVLLISMANTESRALEGNGKLFFLVLS